MLRRLHVWDLKFKMKCVWIPLVPLLHQANKKSTLNSNCLCVFSTCVATTVVFELPLPSLAHTWWFCIQDVIFIGNKSSAKYECSRAIHTLPADVWSFHVPWGQQSCHVESFVAFGFLNSKHLCEWLVGLLGPNDCERMASKLWTAATWCGKQGTMPGS